MPTFDLELRHYLASFMSDHRRQLLPRLLLNRTRHLAVVVEDVFQTHNASACLRSCDCFGVQDVHIIENQNQYLVNENVALGASQWLTLQRYQDTTACLQSLKSRGYAIVMTSPHETDCDLETYDISRPTALVFGNEKSGASDAVRQNADHVMSIPMYGFTESFNISVAVAICLHHLVWRLRESGVDWRLGNDEREELLNEWVRVASETRVEKLEQYFREHREAGKPLQAAAWPDWASVSPHPPEHRSNRIADRS